MEMAIWVSKKNLNVKTHLIFMLFQNWRLITIAKHILYSVNPISQVLGLRYFNVFGINEYHKSKMASVAFIFFNQLNNTLSLFEGSQSFYRDFIYIKDVLKINNFFFKNKLSGIYNCGTGTSRTFYDIASYLQTQHLDQPYPISLSLNILKINIKHLLKQT